MPKNNDIVLLADCASKDMASRIYSILSKRDDMKHLLPFDHDALYINRFANREIDIEVKVNVRNKEVFVIKSSFTIERMKCGCIGLDDMVYGPNSMIMELELINDALVRASAYDIANIIPHMPYQRQDRRAVRYDNEEKKRRRTRSSVSARLVADTLQDSGARRMITVDPHFKQLEGFYKIPFDSLTSTILFAEYIEEIHPSKENLCIIAPDIGAMENADILAEMLNVPIGFIRKKRISPGILADIGGNVVTDIEIKGRDVYVLDDIVDGGGTLIHAANILRKNGAASVTACLSHPILSGDAKERIRAAELNLVTLNTIPIPNLEQYPNIKTIDIAPLIAEAIYSICTDRELSSLFYDYKKYKKKKLEGFGQ